MFKESFFYTGNDIRLKKYLLCRKCHSDIGERQKTEIREISQGEQILIKDFV